MSAKCGLGEFDSFCSGLLRRAKKGVWRLGSPYLKDYYSDPRSVSLIEFPRSRNSSDFSFLPTNKFGSSVAWTTGTRFAGFCTLTTKC